MVHRGVKIPHPLPPLQGWRGGSGSPTPYLGKGLGDGDTHNTLADSFPKQSR